MENTSISDKEDTAITLYTKTRRGCVDTSTDTLEWERIGDRAGSTQRAIGVAGSYGADHP